MLFWNGRIGESLDRFQPALGSIDKNRTGAQNEMDIYFATASQMLGRGQSVIQKYQQRFTNKQGRPAQGEVDRLPGLCSSAVWRFGCGVAVGQDAA